MLLRGFNIMLWLMGLIREAIEFRARAVVHRALNGRLYRDRDKDKRILVVHSGFSMWPHFNIYEINAAFMRRYGRYSVDGLICNRTVKACDFQSSENPDIEEVKDWRKRCSMCIRRTKNRYKLFCDRLVYQDSYLEKDDIERIDGIMSSLGNEIGQDEYCGFTFEGINLGKHAFESFQYYFHLGSVGKLALSPGAAAYEYLKSSMMQAVCARRVLKEYEGILVNDISETLWGPWADVAFSMGKKVIYCGLNGLLSPPPQHYNEIIPRLYSDADTFRLRYPHFPGIEKVNAVLGNLEENTALISTGRHVLEERFGSGKMDEGQLRRRLGIPPNKKAAVIFTHLCWDNSISWGNLPVRSFEEWLSITYDEAVRNDKVVWIIKMHPDELKIDNHPRYNTLNHIRELMKKKPSENIRVIDNPGISTRDLVPVMCAGITLLGSVCYELPSFGLNCIDLTRGIHSGLGFTIDATTMDEYVEVLRRVEELPELTEEARNRALAYTGLLHSEDISISVKGLYGRGGPEVRWLSPTRLDRFVKDNMDRFEEIINRKNI